MNAPVVDPADVSTIPGVSLLTAPTDPRTIELLHYWETRRNGAAMPDRADFDPLDVPRLLPNLLLAEAVDGGRDFRIRLYGTALVALSKEERTGKLMSEIADVPTTPDPDRVRNLWLSVNQLAFQNQGPVAIRTTMHLSNRDYITLEGITLPLRKDGPEVAQLLGGIFVVPTR